MDKKTASLLITIALLVGIILVLVHTNALQTAFSQDSSKDQTTPSPTPTVSVTPTPSTTGFMQTEQASITNVQFSGSTIVVTVSNSGANDVIISSATVNGATAAITNGPVTVPKNTPTATITLTASWDAGSTYQIKLMSSKGTSFPYSAVAQ